VKIGELSDVCVCVCVGGELFCLADTNFARQTKEMKLNLSARPPVRVLPSSIDFKLITFLVLKCFCSSFSNIPVYLVFFFKSN